MRSPLLHVLALALAEDDLHAVRAVITRSLRRDARTLDLGCGPGLFADLFAGGDYVGVDPRARFVAYARRHRPGTFLCEGLAPTGLPAGRFDQALGFDAFGARSDGAGRTILAELRRLLVPGGRVLLIERARSGDRLERLAAALGGVERREPLKSGFRQRELLLVSIRK